MDGNQDGLREKAKAKTDPSGIRADIGKLGSRENGMGAQIYSVNSPKTLLIPIIVTQVSRCHTCFLKTMLGLFYNNFLPSLASCYFH